MSKSIQSCISSGSGRIQRATHASNQGNVWRRRDTRPESAEMESWFRCGENGVRCVAQAWTADRSWKCRLNQGASWKRTLDFLKNTIEKIESSPRYSPSKLNRGTWAMQGNLQANFAFPCKVSETGTRQNFNWAAPVPGRIFTTEARECFHRWWKLVLSE
jgi:hypothetical protein